MFDGFLSGNMEILLQAVAYDLPRGQELKKEDHIAIRQTNDDFVK